MTVNHIAEWVIFSLSYYDIVIFVQTSKKYIHCQKTLKLVVFFHFVVYFLKVLVNTG